MAQAHFHWIFGFYHFYWFCFILEQKNSHARMCSELYFHRSAIANRCCHFVPSAFRWRKFTQSMAPKQHASRSRSPTFSGIKFEIEFLEKACLFKTTFLWHSGVNGNPSQQFIKAAGLNLPAHTWERHWHTNLLLSVALPHAHLMHRFMENT
jgi:hypothetical protein